jgi:hypothetical protein
MKKVLNWIVNNNFSNFVKEVFGIGTDYPTYLYDTLNKEYVVYFHKTISLFGGTEIEITTVPEGNETNPPSLYAHDFRKLNYFQKKSILNDANKAGTARLFVWKHFIQF